METTTRWVNTLAFDAIADKHTARIDTTVAGGGSDSGISPKRMLLCSLSACSGMDVVNILNKMKVPFSKLEIIASADQTEDEPKVFKEINLLYKVDADKSFSAKVERAVDLSQNKYCGIAAMLRKHCSINHSIEYIAST